MIGALAAGRPQTQAEAIRDATAKAVQARNLYTEQMVAELALMLADAEGEVKRVDFWLLFKAVGYDEGFQHAHTVKVVRWSQEDTYLIDLTDDRGRRFHVELVFPDQEPDLASDWRSWRRYKSENWDRFERIDADLLAEHMRIAEEWE